MNDARHGIVRLNLPDGQMVPLTLTYAALDRRGHAWMLEQFRVVQKGKAGAQLALAELLEVLSDGALTAETVMASPVHAYPLGQCLKQAFAAWELAQYGPAGRPAEEGPANPQISPRRTIRWRWPWSRR